MGTASVHMLSQHSIADRDQMQRQIGPGGWCYSKVVAWLTGSLWSRASPVTIWHSSPTPLPGAVLRELSSSVVQRHGCTGVSTLPSLLPQKKSKVHYHIAVIINYLGHCISLLALLVAFVLFLRLR